MRVQADGFHFLPGDLKGERILPHLCEPEPSSRRDQTEMRSSD